MSDNLITTKSAGPPLLQPRALANGTLPSLHLAASRRFYEEVLGVEVRDHPKGLLIRLNGDHTYLIEETPGHEAPMVLLNHNGFYLSADETVEEAHRKVLAAAERHSIRTVTKPNWQHGYYAFFLQDRDGNWWEFHHAPVGPRTDLSGTAALSAQESRGWFQARRRVVDQAKP